MVQGCALCKDGKIVRGYEYASKSKLKMSKVKNIFLSSINNINPFQPSIQNYERQIRLLTLFISVFSIFLLSKEFNGIIFLFSKGISYWGYGTAMYYFPLILLVLAAFLFWLRLKVGWVILCVYLTYSIIRSIGFLIIFWDRDPMGTTMIDSFFSEAIPIYQIITILIFGICFWIIAKNETLKKFHINRKNFFFIISVTVILTFFNNFPSYARAFIFWFVGGE